jgi:ribonuclease HI
VAFFFYIRLWYISLMQKITVFTDGGARGNPGPSGIGAQFLDEKNVVMTELSEYIGEATNNIAEYTAVKRALEHMETFVADTKAVHVLCKLDSQLVERQLKGESQSLLHDSQYQCENLI